MIQPINPTPTATAIAISSFATHPTAYEPHTATAAVSFVQSIYEPPPPVELYLTENMAVTKDEYETGALFYKTFQKLNGNRPKLLKKNKELTFYALMWINRITDPDEYKQCIMFMYHTNKHGKSGGFKKSYIDFFDFVGIHIPQKKITPQIMAIWENEIDILIYN